LSLNNLFGAIGSHLNHAFIINFIGFRDSQNVAPHRKRGQYYAARASDAALTFVVDINFRAARRHYHDS
jgi:hypothetical protein